MSFKKVFIIGLMLGINGLIGSGCSDPKPTVQDPQKGGHIMEDEMQGGNVHSQGGEIAGGMSTEETQNCTRFLYDPTVMEAQPFPNDFYLNQDSEGRSVQISGQPWIEEQGPFVKRFFQDLTALDGWGITAGILMSFEEALLTLPSGKATQEAGTPIQLLRLDEVKEGDQLDQEAVYPRHVPVELRWVEEGKTVIFEPMLPLRPKTQYGLIVKNQWTPVLESDQESDSPINCLHSYSSRSLLFDSEGDLTSFNAHESEELARQTRQGYQILLERSGWNLEQVGAAVVFTTQDALSTSVAIAEKIKTLEYQWNDDAECEESGTYRKCTRSFSAYDFRTEGFVQNDEPQSQFDLIVTSWYPKHRADPLPTLLFGHGIGGDVENIYGVRKQFKDEPITLVAVDAQYHGQHPTNQNPNPLLQVLDFFALDQAEQTLNALTARDNFRHSTYDKLQLIQLLHQDGDLDGDGVDDVDVEYLGYYGLSLGGIMGVELLALESRLKLGVLAVPGARLVSVLTDGAMLEMFLPLIYNLVGGQNIFDRFTPLAQVLIDAADPGTYAPYILTHPQYRQNAPHLLMQMSINDEVVPNPSNRMLARSLQIPLVRKVHQDIDFLPLVDTPVSLNLEGGNSTAGLFQYDRVSSGIQVLPSDHNNVPFGKEASYQSHQFVMSWLEEDHPRIVDPYIIFNVP